MTLVADITPMATFRRTMLERGGQSSGAAFLADFAYKDRRPLELKRKRHSQ